MKTMNQDAIASLLNVLDGLLSEAANLSHAAHDAIEHRDQNLAVGTLVPVEAKLDNALALLRIVISLHRQP